jgi:hypothetical protein
VKKKSIKNMERKSMSLSKWKKHKLDKGKNPANDKGFLCPSPLPPHLTHETGSPCIDQKENWSSESNLWQGKHDKTQEYTLFFAGFFLFSEHRLA